MGHLQQCSGSALSDRAGSLADTRASATLSTLGGDASEYEPRSRRSRRLGSARGRRGTARSSSRRSATSSGCTWTRPSTLASHHRQHRHQGFLKFLEAIDAATPAGLDLHLICGNYATHKTPAVKTWLIGHPRFHIHFTPTSSSWLNLVERWFAELTNRKLRRSAHRSVRELEAGIQAWIQAWNNDPRPFVWTKTADQILESIAARAPVVR